MDRLLSHVATEVAIRSEVQSTLTSLLQDVEHAHDLERSLKAYTELHRCRDELEALSVRYDAREAAWEVDMREKERMGMVLLEEIVRLSAREVKAEICMGEMETRLRQLEDEKSRAECYFGVQQQPQRVAAGIDDREERNINEDGVDKKRTANDANKGEKQIISDATIATANKVADEGTSGSHTSMFSSTDPKLQQSFAPHKLDETTLMIIFAYLEPLDVMNFAQTNKVLLFKVNIMFGMGSGRIEERDVYQRQPTNDSGEDAAAAALALSVEKKIESTPTSQPVEVSVSVTSATPGWTASSSTAPVTEPSTSVSFTSSSPSSPKLLALGPSHKRQGSSTSMATIGSAGTTNPFSQVSSWFAGGTGGGGDASITHASALAAANAATVVTSPTTTSADSGPEIKLNAAMANSMASKLTPAELSIILRMRENLQRCEADAKRWRLEKDDAVANLVSAEAVKEFLVTRVRDTERLVQKQKEDMREVQKKNLEDQEIIVFLDERVNELEKMVEEMKLREVLGKEESLNVAKKNEKKAQVLLDMLRFEREQMGANEQEWKAAKKVLVKEVKSCRACIVALEAEVEGCRQQNVELKQGLVSLTQSPGLMPRGRRRNVRR